MLDIKDFDQQVILELESILKIGRSDNYQYFDFNLQNKILENKDKLLENQKIIPIKIFQNFLPTEEKGDFQIQNPCYYNYRSILILAFDYLFKKSNLKSLAGNEISLRINCNKKLKIYNFITDLILKDQKLDHLYQDKLFEYYLQTLIDSEIIEHLKIVFTSDDSDSKKITHKETKKEKSIHQELIWNFKIN